MLPSERANFRYEQLSAMAAELAQGPVAVIAAIGGTPTGLAAKAATSTVPIVRCTFSGLRGTANRGVGYYK